MKPPAGIKFHYPSKDFSFPHRGRAKKALAELFKKENKRTDAINYIFCSDEYLLTINKQYLNHDTLTDIITFELSPKGQPLVADIFISVERVKDNAKQYAVAFQQELMRVVFHGALHLCGYKDKIASEKILMRKKEDYYLKLYFVPRGT